MTKKAVVDWLVGEGVIQLRTVSLAVNAGPG